MAIDPEAPPSAASASEAAHLAWAPCGTLWSAYPAQRRVVGWRQGQRLVIGSETFGASDGRLHEASFLAPVGLAAAADGALWISDSSTVRRLRGDHIVTIARLPAAGAGLELDEPRGLGYVAVPSHGAVCRVALADGRLSRFIDDLDAPTDIASSPDRHRLYIADRVAIVVVEPRLGLRRVLVAPEAWPADTSLAALTTTPAGLAAVCSASGRLWGINCRHGTITCLARLPSQRGAGVAFDRQARTLLVADTSGGIWQLSRDGGDLQRAHVAS